MDTTQSVRIVWFVVCNSYALITIAPLNQLNRSSSSSTLVGRFHLIHTCVKPITEKHNGTNLTLNMFLYGKKTNKGSKPDTSCMTCKYPGCSKTSSSARKILPSEEIQLRFCEALEYQHCSVMHVCKTCYQRLYWQVHILNPCAGCGAKPS